MMISYFRSIEKHLGPTEGRAGEAHRKRDVEGEGGGFLWEFVSDFVVLAGCYSWSDVSDQFDVCATTVQDKCDYYLTLIYFRWWSRLCAACFLNGSLFVKRWVEVEKEIEGGSRREKERRGRGIFCFFFQNLSIDDPRSLDFEVSPIINLLLHKCIFRSATMLKCVSSSNICFFLLVKWKPNYAVVVVSFRLYFDCLSGIVVAAGRKNFIPEDQHHLDSLVYRWEFNNVFLLFTEN